MKHLITLLIVLIAIGAMAQKNNDEGKFKVYNQGEGFYYESILKDVNAVDEKLNEKEPYKRFVMDQSDLNLPNKPAFIQLPGRKAQFRREMPEPAGVFPLLRFTNRKYTGKQETGEAFRNLYSILGICGKSPAIY